MKPSIKPWVLTGLCLSGCAGLSARLPDIQPGALAGEQSQQEATLFQERAKMQARLMPIADRILAANTALCRKTGADIGVLTHTDKTYAKKLRPAAYREAGAGDEPSIDYVRPGSPADIAGLMRGDVLLGLENEPLLSPSAKLRKLLSGGSALYVERGDETLTLAVIPETRCAYSVKLKMTRTINAYATGKTIIVTAGMMEFADDDDELAMIIGHELAHNELRHIRKIIGNLVLSGFATRYTRPFESEADYVGLYYAARAGFDINGVENLWRRLAAYSATPIVRAKTHPTYPDRYVRLKAARAEINAKKVESLPLTPNMKTKS